MMRAIDASDTGPIIIVSGAAGVGKSTVSRLVAAAFGRSVHLRIDDFMASVVSGWVDPNSPDAGSQNWAVGAAVAVSAMSFAEHGYTTVVDGPLVPDGVEGLAAACATRGLSCHYVVLMADLDTCWTRARERGPGRWPLEFQPFAALHARFTDLDLPEQRVVNAAGSPDTACDAVLSAFRAGRLVVGQQPSSPADAAAASVDDTTNTHLLKLVRYASHNADVARSKRDAAIREAHRAGASLREIAAAGGLSHMSVKRIIEREAG